MYNNGLQDPELQKLHKRVKLNLNLFLNDILNNNLFKVIEKTNYYIIYPLFYCDRIVTDGDAFVNGSYMISCRKNYKQIFLFISDNQIIINKTYTISNILNNLWVIFIYDEWTFQPLRNNQFTINYLNNDKKQYVTDELGYCVFEAEENNFEVIL